LLIDGSKKPDLQIHGYVKDKLVLSRSLSSNPAHDKLWLEADDAELCGEGSDTTRLAFGVVDKHGAPRPFAGGRSSLQSKVREG